MPMISKRADYWNEAYSEYWLRRVEETKTDQLVSSIQAGDRVTEGDEVYFDIFKAHPLLPGNILDVGCGWGRFFPFFVEQGVRVFGIDISLAMVEMFEQFEFSGEYITPPLVAEAEHIPFADCYFDNLVCLAVFDATFQNLSFPEFLRVLKPGGRLYLTGKNANYFEDDMLAFEAELGAAKKGHPNYFTDSKLLIETLVTSGHHVLGQYFFPRRGDFAKQNFHTNLNEEFYEFCIIVEKGREEMISLSQPISRSESHVRAKQRTQ